MKITYYTAAVVKIETNGLKILCDPWLYPGAFYGSWYHYPPFDFDEKEITDVDYIYISHTHEDHLCKKSLDIFDKKIPILINKFKSPFVKRIIESIGFENVIEITHGEKLCLNEKVHFRVFSCEETCPSQEGKQTAIDTYCVVNDEEYTFVNTNDNFIENIEDQIKQIKKEYKKIDFLANVYTSASCYPQTTVSLTQKELKNEIKKVSKWCYDKSATMIRTLRPRYYMPFAGSYILAGKLSSLNENRVNSTPFDAKKYFEENYPYMLKDSKCVVLNSGEFFDLATETASKDYVHFDEDEKNRYIKEVLSKVSFDYELEPFVDSKELENSIRDLLPFCYKRMERNRDRLGYKSDTQVFIKFDEEKYIFVSMSGEGCRVVFENEFIKIRSEPFIIMEMDSRLLTKILNGPSFAHWDNADTGSHIIYRKFPNIFEKGIYHTICYFHR